ncbi:MAG: ABC transporter substrate-binding protein [Treponema sp.]|jgi:putative aldouronate transport system substrate-binding protein|nr:ABC transporter substrate-binding protein [Treponema sp.]
MKKVFVYLAVAVLLVSAGGKVSASGSSSRDSGGSSSGAVPTLIWWQIGSAQGGIAEDLAVISNYTQEKIGVRLDVKQAGWGDAGQRFTTMINAGEYYDILFTDLGSYNRFVGMGAFADLTDILPKETPKLWDYVPDLLWNGAKIKGRIYAVPTYKDSSKTVYQFWDHAIVEKYGLDINTTITWAGLDRALRTIKAGEGARYYPFIMSRSINNFYFDQYDSLAADLPVIGVRLDDTQHRVVNTLEQPDIQEALRYFHTWYEAGIINPDANMVDETPKYRPFFMSQAWPAVAASYATSAGIDKYDSVRFFGPSYSTDSIQGSMNAVNVNSRYKTEAIKLLELVNTDRKLRDMIAYGIEGKHFTYVNNGTAVRRDRTDWPLVNYQEGSFFIETPENTVPPGYWEEVQKLNEEATPSVMLGFILDLEPIRNEVANCRTTWTKYFTDLNTGASDPAVILPQAIAELKTAGLDKVIAEAQRQVNEYFQAQGR